MYFEFLFIFTGLWFLIALYPYVKLSKTRKQKTSIYALGGGRFQVRDDKGYIEYTLAGILVPTLEQPFGAEAFQFFEDVIRKHKDFILPEAQGDRILLGLKLKDEWYSMAELLLQEGWATADPKTGMYDNYVLLEFGARENKRGMHTNVVQLRVG